jgi:putative aldouronate transport system permease protein
MTNTGALNSPSRVRLSASTKVFHFMDYIVITLITAVCVLPFILLISASFSSDTAIRFNGYSILPQDFTLDAYEMIFKYPSKIARAYGVSIFILPPSLTAAWFVPTFSISGISILKTIFWL